jgi:hypothetical protein
MGLGMTRTDQELVHRFGGIGGTTRRAATATADMGWCLWHDPCGFLVPKPLGARLRALFQARAVRRERGSRLRPMGAPFVLGEFFLQQIIGVAERGFGLFCGEV